MKRIKATILVRTPDDVWRRVGKIIGYNYDPSKKNSDGGFCFCLPSHTKLSGEASGLLEKTGRVDSINPTDARYRHHPPNERRFSISEEVKVSFHADGNIQFSGERVTSGWDENGEPKGLSIRSKAFTEVPQTLFPPLPPAPPLFVGIPVFAMDMWGMQQFLPRAEIEANSVCFDRTIFR